MLQLADGSLSDLSSITWSVRAGTGTEGNFLTITGSGGMMNMIANSAGQGTIFATFGTQIAQCDVIVQPGKKMAFQTGAVSGSPGDSFTVGYDYSPTTMSVSWTISDSSVASYSVDSSAKKVTITLAQGRDDQPAGIFSRVDGLHARGPGNNVGTVVDGLLGRGLGQVGHGQMTACTGRLVRGIGERSLPGENRMLRRGLRRRRDAEDDERARRNDKSGKG